jgi:hypothetical protein
MRITSSDISLAASRIDIKTTSVYERLRKWDKSSDITSETYKENATVTSSSLKMKDIFVNSGQKGPPAFINMFPSPSVTWEDVIKKMKEEFIGSVKDQIMKDMIELITGKKIKLLDPSSLQWSDNGADCSDAQDAQNAKSADQTSAPQLEGWGVDYYYRETKTTKEGVAVSASGAVTTADGRSLNFDASLEMSRETFDEITVSVKAGDALIDPLMIDTTGKGVQLSGVKFNFDLNADGINESINAPGPGSGFVAYDRNGNGIVDNGAELFGPQSGNGFSELSQFDDDKNGWIDENDSVFSRLSVWQKAADGTDSLMSLNNSGIGAIYLGHAASHFDLTDANNPQSTSVAGVLRETGVFLRENGQTGFVQEVDLVA